MSQVFQWKPIRGPLKDKFKQKHKRYVKNFINSTSLDYIKGPMLRFALKLRNLSNLLLNIQPTPDTMACCATSFCGFPTCSTGGICGSSCCQPSCCETSCFQPSCCETGYGFGGGIGCGQEGGSGAVSYRVRWCRPDCRVEGTCLPPCCVVSCVPPTCCQLHHAQASCCRPSYCGQSCCRPACCCYCC